MQRRPPLILGAAVTCVSALALTGCAAPPVAVAPPSATASSGDTTRICAALLSSLPGYVLGGLRRTTTPWSIRTAAWGDVPVVLTCGVATERPAPTEQLLSVNGVDWRTVALTSGTAFVTVKRSVPVQVAVPSSYPAAPEALPAVSKAIDATVPLVPAD